MAPASRSRGTRSLASTANPHTPTSVRHGFTLLEVLTSVVLLGLLASATMPMMLRLGRAHEHFTDRRGAQAALAVMARSGDVGAARAIPGHPEWRISQIDLTADPPPAPPIGVVPPVVPVHRWRWLVVRVGAEADAPILAQRLVLVLPERP